ncbi:MAG: hypothetical protein UHS32_05045, partial [Bacteroidaceae bacterium]|nr:hypothetical protein [Bacteroidaceae bacterium]
MRRIILIAFLLTGAIGLSAQVKFTERLQQGIPGQGKVVLHQSKAIEDLVNNVAASAMPKPAVGTPV